jgi:hypothetical protein
MIATIGINYENSIHHQRLPFHTTILFLLQRAITPITKSIRPSATLGAPVYETDATHVR